MSMHEVLVIEIGEIFPHPNGDKLELIQVWGWQCCIAKGQFKTGDKAAYIEPDFLCPLDRPEFSFLRKKDSTKTKERIKVRRLRGELSQGLIIPLPAHLDVPVGTNIITELGVERYEPPEDMSTGGDFVHGPDGLYCPKFDLENYAKYGKHCFVEGEPVVITEKLHGSSSRFLWHDGQQFCGSRKNWMEEDEKNIWWKVFKSDPGIKSWCEANPSKILFGEVFGQVQTLKYGAGRNDLFFAAFAMLDKQEWISYKDIADSLKEHNVTLAPLLYRGPLDEKMAKELAEGDSSWLGANHMREGVVIVPEIERTHRKVGRVALKLVSNRYLES